MTLEQALDIVVAKTRVERHRWGCSAENELPAPNDRETWKKWVMDEAQGYHDLPDITAHLAEASQQPVQVKPCGGCP